MGWVRIANDPETLVSEVVKCGEHPEVAIEATYGWYWAVDALQTAGANVHLVAPSRLSAFEGRRVKNDQRDCQVLGDLLRANMLPEAWISTPEVREWRELVRYRAKLVGLRAGLKAQVHAVLAKHGVHVPMTDLFGVGGREMLTRLCEIDPRFHSPYGQRIESLVVLIDAFGHEIEELNSSISRVLRAHAGYGAIQQIPGIGPTIAAILVAEIGDVHRFRSAAHLASWCGLTPRHRESDTTIRRGPITKQGSRLVRWAVIEAAQKLRKDSWLRAERERLAERRNSRNIAKTAIARKMITLVYYGLRDGHIRCLDHADAA
ncbi:MAG TPA: IS110 family transposase [Solirubrobacteraceae bacterium]